MAVPYDDLMKLERRSRFSWDERDAIIYALGIGMPSDPSDEQQLPFVYEPWLKVLPTFAVTMPLNALSTDDGKINKKMVLHGEQALTLLKPIPPSGTVEVHSRVTGAWDKGPEKGGVIQDTSTLTLEGETEPLAEVITTTFARGDGGFGGPREGQPAPHPIPDRAPDKVVEIATDRNQAIAYRMAGDLNPLHIDPAVAKAAGFPEPILHGLCSYAICQRAILSEYCDFDPALLRHIAIRFASPVFPGETLRIALWKDGETVSFEAYVVERDIQVIRNGKAIVAA